MSNKRANEIIYGKEARRALKEGIDKVANAAKVTLGSQGRNVLISNSNGEPPHISKDGVTVVKSIDLPDALERQGELLIKQVAITTNNAVGDGTTTSVVLAQEMSDKGLPLVDDNSINVMQLKKGMESALNDVLAELKDLSVIDHSKDFIRNIATISANNDSHLGGLIADAYEQVGMYGVISIDRSENTDSYIEKVDGYQFDRGVITPLLFTNAQRGRSELAKPYVLVTDHVLSDASEFEDLMNAVAKQYRPILIICDEMEFSCTQDFLRNHLSGYVKVAIVKAPEYGDRRYDMLHDICAVTGATLISKELGHKISDVTIEQLGEADSVVSDLDLTTIVGGQGLEELITERIESIQGLKEGKKGFELETLEKRLGKLTGGAAVLHLGAKSEVDLKELKDRAEDALNAVKASIEDGVLPGGGTIFYKMSYQLEPELGNTTSFEKGYKIVTDSLKKPLLTICSNAGIDLATIDKLNLLDYEEGIDANTGEIVNMLDRGIIDPTKVLTSSIGNAVSVVSTLLLTEVVVLGDDYSQDNPQTLF